MNNYQNMYQEQAPEGALSVTAVQTKPEITYTGAERITAVIMLVLGFLWVRLALYHVTGVFTTLLYAAIITAQVIFLKKGGVQFSRSEKLAIAAEYAFSLVFSVTANELLKALTVIYLIMAGGLLLLHTTSPDCDILRFLPVSLAKGIFGAPFISFSAGAGAITSGAKGKGFWKNAGYVVLGLVLAVPVTCIAGALLCSADENMNRLISGLFRFPEEETFLLLFHMGLGIPVGLGLFSALFTAVRKNLTVNAQECTDMAKACRIVPTPVIYAAVTPLCLLYLLFFFSQLQYFLGGFTGDVSGFTYAEYARRGFFELCGVCCMNVLVIACMGFFAKRAGEGKALALRIYASFLCVSSLLLAGTALAKMFLYIRVYGMTQLRIYTTWFMFLLVIGFAALLVRQFKEELNLGRLGVIVFTVMFALLCFSRPDAWMTRYNAEMYLSGQLEEFDQSVLYEMSDDAWAGLTAYNGQTLDRLLDADGRRGFTAHTDGTAYDDLWEKLNLSALELMLYAK